MITEQELLDAGFQIDQHDPQFKYWRYTNFDYDKSLLDPPVIVYDTVRNRFALYDGGEMFIYTKHKSVKEIIEWSDCINDFHFN